MYSILISLMADRIRLATQFLIALFCLCNLYFPVTAQVNTKQLISISLKHATLIEVFKAIERQTKYGFLYNSDDLKKVPPVDIDVKDATIDRIMQIVLKNQRFSYLMKGNNIIISLQSPSPSPTLEKTSPIDTTVTVSGYVKDAITGKPVAGAAVMEKGTKNGTATKNDGGYTLHLSRQGNPILQVRSLGYVEQEIPVLGRRDITIGMNYSFNPLDETVVIAYGTTTRRLNTGSVSVVKNKEIQSQPVSNVLTALQGRVPGLYIQQNSGVSDGAIQITLRGQNSIANGNNPLYIIDGVPYSGKPFATVPDWIGGFGGSASPLSYINPADIERIDVLKDADATAIYGSRGSNGVILITTKKGVTGKTRASFRAYTGIGNVARRMELLNLQQYLQMRKEALENDNSSPQSWEYDINGTWDTSRSTNWQKELIGGTAILSDAQLSISGGNESTQFWAGGGYHRETTVFPGNFANNKISTNLNLRHASRDRRFFMEMSANFLGNINTIPSVDLTQAALTLPPDAPKLYDSLGNLNWQNSTWTNPLAYTMQKYKSNASNLISNLIFGYNILPELQLKVSGGYTQTYVNEISTNPLSSQDPGFSWATSSTLFGNSTYRTWIIEPQLTYTKKNAFGELSLLVGATLQKNLTQSMIQYGYGFSNDALIENIQAVPSGNLLVYNNINTMYRYAAAFGRINYNIANKYVINLTARRDGSSRFGPDRQFGNFGALGATWIFSGERWVREELKFMSFGKIRFSYGLTGNDQTNDYQYLDTYSSSVYSYLNVSGLYPTQLYNPNFGWETNKKLEIALELGLLQNSINLSAAYFRNRSSNQLVQSPLPPTTGGSAVVANLAAHLQNSGGEFLVESRNIEGNDFKWITSINITLPYSKLIAFPGLQSSIYRNTYAIGRPLDIKKVYISRGVDASTGLYVFEDIKGNLTSSPSSANDRQFASRIGRMMYGGISNTFTYKSFSADIFIQFVKQKVRNSLFSTFNVPGQLGNQPALVMNRWQKPGDQTSVQKFTASYDAAYNAWSKANSSGSNNISDGSFIRLKNISISYHVSERLARNMKLQDASLFLQAQNVVTIAGFNKGIFDPEQSSVQNLPPLRMLTAGIQIIL